MYGAHAWTGRCFLGMRGVRGTCVRYSYSRSVRCTISLATPGTQVGWTCLLENGRARVRYTSPWIRRWQRSQRCARDMGVTYMHEDVTVSVHYETRRTVRAGVGRRYLRVELGPWQRALLRPGGEEPQCAARPAHHQITRRHCRRLTRCRHARYGEHTNASPTPHGPARFWVFPPCP